MTLDKIAREAGVTRQHVSHVLNGKFKSRRVVEITKRLIAEKKAARNGAPLSVEGAA